MRHFLALVFILCSSLCAQFKFELLGARSTFVAYYNGQPALCVVWVRQPGAPREPLFRITASGNPKEALWPLPKIPSIMVWKDWSDNWPTGDCFLHPVGDPMHVIGPIAQFPIRGYEWTLYQPTFPIVVPEVPEFTSISYDMHVCDRFDECQPNPKPNVVWMLFTFP